jgi:hypothetical protein
MLALLSFRAVIVGGSDGYVHISWHQSQGYDRLGLSFFRALSHANCGTAGRLADVVRSFWQYPCVTHDPYITDTQTVSFLYSIQLSWMFSGHYPMRSYLLTPTYTRYNATNWIRTLDPWVWYGEFSLVVENRAHNYWENIPLSQKGAMTSKLVLDSHIF